MMNNIGMILVIIGGGLIGAFFFGGLWLTVRMATASKAPALWFTLSFLLRVTISLGGFYLLAQADWRRWLLCLSGFMMARIIITRLTRPVAKQEISRKKEVRHEA